MDLIDEDGNVLGYVNLIDALVVLLLVALAVGAIALVLAPTDQEPDSQPGPNQTGTRHVTVDLGNQPLYILDAIHIGDTYSPNEHEEFEITDVYYAGEGSKLPTLVRARLVGEARSGSVRFNGEPLRLGRNISIDTHAYSVTGTIAAVGSTETLDRRDIDVLLRATLDPADAAAISVGDTYEVADRTLATVKTVSTYRTGDPNQRLVYTGVSLSVVRTEHRTMFGDRRIREGVIVPVHTPAYEINGRIVRFDAAELPGRETTREVTLQMTSVSPDRAALIRPGLVERGDGGTVARIINVESEPSPAVLTSDGNIFVRDHPLKKDLLITAELTVRETESDTLYKGRRLQQGSTVALVLEGGVFEARVVSI